MNILKSRLTGNGLKSLQSSLKFTKDLISKGLTTEVIFKHVIANGMSVGQVTTITDNPDGQLQFDFSSIKVNDIYKIYDQTKTDVIGNDFWSLEDKDVTTPVIDKLSESTKIDIKIPESHVPKIDIPIVRAA